MDQVDKVAISIDFVDMKWAVSNWLDTAHLKNFLLNLLDTALTSNFELIRSYLTISKNFAKIHWHNFNSDKVFPKYTDITLMPGT